MQKRRAEDANEADDAEQAIAADRQQQSLMAVSTDPYDASYGSSVPTKSQTGSHEPTKSQLGSPMSPAINAEEADKADEAEEASTFVNHGGKSGYISQDERQKMRATEADKAHDADKAGDANKADDAEDSMQTMQQRRA